MSATKAAPALVPPAGSPFGHGDVSKVKLGGLGAQGVRRPVAAGKAPCFVKSYEAAPQGLKKFKVRGVIDYRKSKDAWWYGPTPPFAYVVAKDAKDAKELYEDEYEIPDFVEVKAWELAD